MQSNPARRHTGGGDTQLIMSSPTRHIPKLPFSFSTHPASPATQDYLSKTAVPRVDSPKASPGIIARCAAGASKKRSRGEVNRKPSSFKPIDTPVFVKRDALQDLGPIVQKTRDMIVCLGGSLVTQLAADCYRDLGITRAFRELSDTVASDCKGAMQASFDRGVAHGKWLISVPEVEQENEKIRVAYFNLQNQYRDLHELSQAQKARLAHLEAVAKTPFTPGVHDFEVDNAALMHELDKDQLDINDLLNLCGPETGRTIDERYPDWGMDLSALNDYLDGQAEPELIVPHRQFATMDV